MSSSTPVPHPMAHIEDVFSLSPIEISAADNILPSSFDGSGIKIDSVSLGVTVL